MHQPQKYLCPWINFFYMSIWKCMCFCISVWINMYECICSVCVMCGHAHWLPDVSVLLCVNSVNGRWYKCFLYTCYVCMRRLSQFWKVQLVKNSPAMWETWVQPLGWEDPLEKATASHSSILAWRIPWTIDKVHGVAKSWTQLSNFHLLSFLSGFAKYGDLNIPTTETCPKHISTLHLSNATHYLNCFNEQGCSMKCMVYSRKLHSPDCNPWYSEAPSSG